MDIQFNPDPSDMIKLYFDRRRLQQVLLNLLSNAIKFQDSGKIVVKLTTVPEVDNEEICKIYVLVKDQGIGLSPNEMKNVLKLNWRSDTKTSRNLNSHGNGLGLFICKSICESLGGEIRV